MAIQDFTAGQVLTAAEMDSLQANDYNQTVSTKTDSYVLVAADKGTRVVMNAATAKTFTVNSGLFAAGDTLVLQNIGAGTATVTAGTCTVNTSGSLALAQWQGGTLYFTSASAAIFFPSDKTAASGAGNFVSTSQTTASTSYVDLATVGATTLTTGTSALVTVSCNAQNVTTGASVYMSFAVSGATTTAASDTYATWYRNSTNYQTALSNTFLVTLTAGSNTFTSKFRVDAGTGIFLSRNISVIAI
jgi:hypothetical protein